MMGKTVAMVTAQKRMKILEWGETKSSLGDNGPMLVSLDQVLARNKLIVSTYAPRSKNR